ncbi:MAG: hypothetical protein BYD32DRAFT_417299 [Podila humilis]|nr:MAG: hypothetical protein BYD32DRAFT_417299 [Podila humilis]
MRHAYSLILIFLIAFFYCRPAFAVSTTVTVAFRIERDIWGANPKVFLKGEVTVQGYPTVKYSGEQWCPGQKCDYDFLMFGECTPMNFNPERGIATYNWRNCESKKDCFSSRQTLNNNPVSRKYVSYHGKEYYQLVYYGWVDIPTGCS